MPLVSCICVTRDRRSFIGIALRAFLAQNWPDKELLVLDDGEDPVRDLCELLPGCRYVRLRGTQTIGAKRNLACELAQGEILAHWDDDDWSAATRITDQVERLRESGKAVSGYHSLLFWDGERGFKYKGFPRYSLGSALCFRRDFWKQHRFITNAVRHEDNAFVQQAQMAQQIVSVDGGALMVARIHAGNSSPKKPLESPQQWQPVESSQIPEDFLKAIA